MTRVGASRVPTPKPKRDSSVTARRENKAPSNLPSNQRLDAGRLGSAPVDQAVIALVKEIASDDPQRRKKAFQCFLGHAIRKNLMATQIDGKAFSALVENTMAQMEADAELNQEMIQATDVLIALADQANLKPAAR